MRKASVANLVCREWATSEFQKPSLSKWGQIVHNLSCENEFYLHENKNSFHIKGWALHLVLKQRPGGTRKWPIDIRRRFLNMRPVLTIRSKHVARKRPSSSSSSSYLFLLFFSCCCCCCSSYSALVGLFYKSFLKFHCFLFKLAT